VTSGNDFGEIYERWSGVDIGVDVRLPGLLVRGGISTGQNSYDNCEVGAKLPEMLGVRFGGLASRATSRRSRPWRSASVTSTRKS
jgi:hypothetical protein